MVPVPAEVGHSLLLYPVAGVPVEQVKLSAVGGVGSDVPGKSETVTATLRINSHLNGTTYSYILPIAKRPLTTC